MRLNKIVILSLMVLGLSAWKCEDKKSEEAAVVPTPDSAVPAAAQQPTDGAAGLAPATGDAGVQPPAGAAAPADVAPTDGYTGEEPVPTDVAAPAPADAPPAPQK